MEKKAATTLCIASILLELSCITEIIYLEITYQLIG